MLSLDTIKQIKQSNVSKDAEKTKARIKEEFTAAPKDIKAAIIGRTTQNRNTIYRAIHTGSASGRIILAFAETLDISPFYFTGAIDEKEACTEKAVKNFLSEYGYKKLAPKPEKKVRKQPEKPAESESESIPPAITAEAHPTVFRVSINESDKMRSMVDELDLASASQLLEALFIRAKAGGNAEQLCEIVKYCLLA
ncbi:MAG: hypothetical protein FWH16_04765 [Oscillospiraceae bacterium]|nr:hypothetical protein [Oscillospiraceae bacterium]